MRERRHGRDVGRQLVVLLARLRVWRIVFMFSAAIVVADTTGLLSEADDTQCCDESDGKQCPPACPTCTCAWHSLTSAPTAIIEIKPIDLTASTLDLPPPGGADGRTAPAPITRPPIV
jgi:hypothetical protein